MNVSDYSGGTVMEFHHIPFAGYHTKTVLHEALTNRQDFLYKFMGLG